MSGSESDESVIEFDFDTDISEFSGFSAEESSDSEVDEVDESALADPEWQGHFAPPMVRFIAIYHFTDYDFTRLKKTFHGGRGS